MEKDGLTTQRFIKHLMLHLKPTSDRHTLVKTMVMSFNGVVFLTGNFCEIASLNPLTLKTPPAMIFASADFGTLSLTVDGWSFYNPYR